MRIKFSRMNFESECAYDCINGKGFLISDIPFSDVDKSIRNVDGPRSGATASGMTGALGSAVLTIK